MIVEGDSFIKNVVNRTLKGSEAKAILDDLEKKKQDKPFIWSRNVNPATLAAYIEGEHPQTIAMILAHMPSEISSEIIMSLPDELKGRVYYQPGDNKLEQQAQAYWQKVKGSRQN